MPQLNTLRITFDSALQQRELTMFRGAIAHKAGVENTLFHNHEGDGFRYAYPMIQYKRLRQKPTIVCVGEGVDSMHSLFAQRDWSLNLNGRKMDLRVEQLHLSDHTLQLSDTRFTYRLRDWLALDQKSYADFRALASDPAAQHRLLETKLRGNILSFAKSVGWWLSPEQRIEVSIAAFHPVRVPFKGISMCGFHVIFSCNVSLPPYIGLGKGVSHGNGVLLPVG